jgi:hypothetical protein
MYINFDFLSLSTFFLSHNEYTIFKFRTIDDYKNMISLNKRARWKVLGLTYVKLGTSGCWVENRTAAGVTATLRAFLVAAHDSMGIGCSIQARWKFLGLAYIRHETRDKRPLVRGPDRSWCHRQTSLKLSLSQPGLSSRILVCCRRCSGAMGCDQKKLYTTSGGDTWSSPGPYSTGAFPEFHVGCRLG